jgi:hypothetical protein
MQEEEDSFSARMRALVSTGNQEETQNTFSSKIKSAVGTERSFLQDAGAGARRPVEVMASMFSGDPQLRGLPPIADAPDTLGGRMGEMASEAALMAVPFGAMAKGVQPAAQGANRIMGTLQNVVSDVGKGFAKSPTRFVATEAALGSTAAAGGYFAQQRFPDSEAARFVGEIAGGIAPSAIVGGASAAGRGVEQLARYSPFAGPALRTWDDVKRMMDATTAGTRATERFGRAVDSPDMALQAMGEDLLPEARDIMTPAQLSGQSGLLSLEKSLIESSDKLADKSAEQLLRLNDVIKNSLTTRSGASAAAVQSLEDTRQNYRNLLNERLSVAALRTDEAISRMVPGLPAEEANRIASIQLDRALKDANTMEGELFGLVDQTAIAPTANASNALRDAMAEMGQTGMRNIPSYARQFFDPQSVDYLGSTTTVRELRNAQSSLREMARNARQGSGRSVNLNLARIADNLANAITDDLSMTDGANSELIQNAVAFSREKNQAFRQGSVGRILRTATDGGDVVPPALTLVDSIGLSGPRGAQAFDDIMEAAAFSANNAGFEGTGGLYDAMDSFVKHDFLSKVVRNGEVSDSAVNTFLRNNEGILNRFPQIRQDINNVVSSANRLEAANEMRKAFKYFDDPNVSKAALFIKKGPEDAFKSVMESRSPRAEMRTLIDLVSQDQTGAALDGLKAGFFEYLMGQADQGGFISGAKLSDITGSVKGRGAIEALFTEAERNRLYTVVRTAERLDAARSARPSREGIMGDELSGAVQTTLGILGAAFGRQTSSNLGGGTVQIPGIMAERFRSLGRAGLLNPAKRLVIDALGDEKLFREVLMASVNNPTAPLSQQATRRLNAWAAAAAMNLNDTEEQGDGEQNN